MLGACARRILVVEDDPEILALVRMHLEDAGFDVSEVTSGSAALEVAKEDFSLVVLDLMLPGIDGIEVCRALRESGCSVPILMLTARSTELDRVLGLEIGADDYLTKPFSLAELVARVKAILRRASATERSPAATEPLQIDGLTIDERRRLVEIGGRSIELTAKEFDLLSLFAHHPGQVFTRAQLLDDVWGYSHAGYEHTVNSHINRLRSKIEPDPSRPRYVLTVWGVGYRFRDPDRPDEP